MYQTLGSIVLTDLQWWHLLGLVSSNFFSSASTTPVLFKYILVAAAVVGNE
jgi:hypothetical protein